jgi:hypothetical protein|tara:strand:- start:2204 stop:2569 length:366 start_codon:yes stop_codon:yes gene_type:complete
MATDYFGTFSDFSYSPEVSSMLSRNFLESTPTAAYYSSPTGREFGTRSPNRQRFFQESFQDIYNQYLGELGSKARQNQISPLRFADYLERDPFTERYSALSPIQRGIYSQQFSPSTRFIYY